jgi:hypothetical protein
MTMKTHALTNPIVKTAIEALQNGDQKARSALFEPDAELYDDGALVASRNLPAMRSVTSGSLQSTASRTTGWS